MSHQHELKSTPLVVSNWYRQVTLVQKERSVDSGKMVYLSLQKPVSDGRLISMQYSRVSLMFSAGRTTGFHRQRRQNYLN